MLGRFTQRRFRQCCHPMCPLEGFSAISKADLVTIKILHACSCACTPKFLRTRFIILSVVPFCFFSSERFNNAAEYLTSPGTSSCYLLVFRERKQNECARSTVKNRAVKHCGNLVKERGRSTPLASCLV